MVGFYGLYELLSLLEYLSNIFISICIYIFIFLRENLLTMRVANN